MFVNPHKVGSSTINGLFAPKNCDNSSTPFTNLDSAENNYHSRISLKEIDCTNGFQGACDAVDTAHTCLVAAFNLAANSAPIPLDGSTASQGLGYANIALGEAGSHLSATAPTSPTGFQFSVASGIVSVVGTMNSLSSAYGSCAP